MSTIIYLIIYYSVYPTWSFPGHILFSFIRPFVVYRVWEFMGFKDLITKDSSTNNDENEKSDRKTVKMGPFLAESGNAPGTIKMTLISPKALEQKSLESINNAMLLVKEFSKKVGDTVEETPVEFRHSQVQLFFNLNLTTDGRAAISKSEKGANPEVTFMRKNEGKDSREAIGQGRE